MPLEAEPSASDFLTLIAWWNLYGLPALLTVVALVLAIRQYNRPDAGQDRLAEAIGTNNPRNSETQDHRRRPRIKIAPETTELARHAMGQVSWSWPRLFLSTRNSGRIVVS
jgi:hypothetical protein